MERGPEGRAAPAEDLVRIGLVVLAGFILLFVTGAAASGNGGGATASASTPRAAPVRYDLALGDSLAAGVGASAPAQGYAGLLFVAERHQLPGLKLVDLACAGATTTTFVVGGGCSYAGGSQLAAAESFLRTHRGSVGFVTLDIGLNDVDACMSIVTIDAACAGQGLLQANTGLRDILAGLRRADPHVTLVGADYYDPFLAAWGDGASGRTVARQSEMDVLALDGVLSQAYRDNSVPVAAVAARFATPDAAPASTAGGSVPLGVHLVCRWTWMCTGGNLHPNDAGYRQLAAAFAAVLKTGSVGRIPG